MPFETRNKNGSLTPWLSYAALAVLCATGSVFLAGDALLQSQFQTAFQNHKSLTTSSAKLASKRPVPVTGSEAYWLGDARLTHVTPANWQSARPLSTGDKITMTANGEKRQLEVIAVKSLNAQALTGASGSSHALLITLRPADGSKGSNVHILIDKTDDLSPLGGQAQPSHEL